MKFVILSPRQIGGGPIVLHILCRELIKCGHNAKILYVPGAKIKQSKLMFWTRWIMSNLLFLFRRCAYLVGCMLGKKDKAPYADYFRSPVKGTKRKWMEYYWRMFTDWWRNLLRTWRHRRNVKRLVAEGVAKTFRSPRKQNR